MESSALEMGLVSRQLLGRVHLHIGPQSSGGLSLRPTDMAYQPVENTPWKNSLQGRVLSDMEIRDILAQNLRRYRLANGLSQEELAHRAGIDRTYISSLERSVYAAGIDVVDRLAKELGLEAADLLRQSDGLESPEERDAISKDQK